ncbi:unnamed protein product [Cylindrotheca closterium]|uniref:Uncharacterized protein n=1 Tax=Cylindrotheca closterium TaxID=2856 RepID=A0AAD2CQI1_9STRA|nr:unnamed protein product [Cylindrotheca closterium]
MHLIMLYHEAYTASPASGEKLHRLIKEPSIQERTGSSIFIFSFTRDSNTWRLQALPNIAASISGLVRKLSFLEYSKLSIKIYFRFSSARKHSLQAMRAAQCPAFRLPKNTGKRLTGWLVRARVMALLNKKSKIVLFRNCNVVTQINGIGSVRARLKVLSRFLHDAFYLPLPAPICCVFQFLVFLSQPVPNACVLCL